MRQFFLWSIKLRKKLEKEKHRRRLLLLDLDTPLEKVLPSIEQKWVWYNFVLMGCHHNSVDSSVPSILPPWVRVPNIPSTLLSIYIDLCHVEKTKINKKEASIGPFKKHFVLIGFYIGLVGDRIMYHCGLWAFDECLLGYLHLIQTKIKGWDLVVMRTIDKAGYLLDFGQFFKAVGNNQFAQISHILRQFCEGIKIYHFLATFIDICRFFSGHTGCKILISLRAVDKNICSLDQSSFSSFNKVYIK